MLNVLYNVVDKNGKAVFLRGASYNKACVWIEKALAVNGNKILECKMLGNDTLIKTSGIDFIYIENSGELKEF